MRGAFIPSGRPPPPFSSSLPSALPLSRMVLPHFPRERGLDCCFFPRFPARHIVLPVVEARRRRVPLHNVQDVLERIGASGPDDIFPSRLLSEINCHSIFIVVYLSRQLPPRPLSLDNRLINQASFVAAVTVFCLSSFVERTRRRDEAPVSLIDYRRESIDLAPSLMNIIRNLVKTGGVANISIMLYKYVKFYISIYGNHIIYG